MDSTIPPSEVWMMKPNVELNDIVDGMQWQTDSIAAYLNTKTGQVVPVSDDELIDAEFDDDSLPLTGWEAEAAEVAKAVAKGNDYIALPDRFEIDEYRIMERFASGVVGGARSILLEAIRGSGAFRYFRRTIHELGLVQEWYSYRDGAYKQIAEDWCRENGIAYSQPSGPVDADA